MERSALTAGDPIEARCTKCRTITNHIVVAMQDNLPVKVQCNTCSGQHKYRPVTTTKKSAARQSAGSKTTVRQTVASKTADQKEWAQLRPDMNSDEAVNYSTNASYKVGALINHSEFGLGINQRVVGPQKIEVLFETGKKIMRCK